MCYSTLKPCLSPLNVALIHKAEVRTRSKVLCPKGPVPRSRNMDGSYLALYQVSGTCGEANTRDIPLSRALVPNIYQVLISLALKVVTDPGPPSLTYEFLSTSEVIKNRCRFQEQWVRHGRF